MNEFKFLAYLPNRQNSISFGEDTARIILDVPLNTEDQQQAVMLMQLLRKKVFNLTVTPEDYKAEKHNPPMVDDIGSSDYQFS